MGAAGVFLLDSKNLLGAATIENGRLVVRRNEAPEDSYAFDRLAGFMRASAIALKDELAVRTGAAVYVTAVVVVWPRLDGGVVEADRVVYVDGALLRGWLQEQPARLYGTRLAHVADAARSL